MDMTSALAGKIEKRIIKKEFGLEVRIIGLQVAVPAIDHRNFGNALCGEKSSPSLFAHNFTIGSTGKLACNR